MSQVDILLPRTLLLGIESFELQDPVRDSATGIFMKIYEFLTRGNALGHNSPDCEILMVADPFCGCPAKLFDCPPAIPS